MSDEAQDRAVQTAYDAVAPDYARLLPDTSAEAPLDLAVLAAFADMCTAPGAARSRVADVGCGTGRVTRRLADADLDLLGLDLSPRMVEQARRLHPQLPFAVARAQALPLRTGVLDGVLSWYSLVHLPPARLPAVVAELGRVLRPGAPLLLAVQCGEGERVDRDTSYGHPVPLTYYRHSVEHLTTALDGAFTVHATVRREAFRAHETTPQALVLALRR